MTLIEHADLLQGTDEWLKIRRGMITASVVGKLITTRSRSPIEYGCSDCSAFPMEPCTSRARKGDEKGAPIKTVHPARNDAARFDSSPPELVVANTDEACRAIATVVTERITGFIEPVWLSNDMLRGMDDEPLARNVYAEHYAPVREVGIFIEDKWGFRIGFSPDGVVGDDGLIEIKSRRSYIQLRGIIADEVPAENMAQLQTGLLVTGRDWIDYVSYCGGMPLYVKRVYPDPRWQKAIVAAARHFEDAAEQMTRDYSAAIKGRPMTERVEMEMTL